MVGTSRVAQDQASICNQSTSAAASPAAQEGAVDAIDAHEEVAVAKKEGAVRVEKEPAINKNRGGFAEIQE